MNQEINVNDVIEEIVGLNILKASKIVRDNGFVFRVTATDGIAHVTTRDYKVNRINVAIESNEVVDAKVG